MSNNTVAHVVTESDLDAVGVHRDEVGNIRTGDGGFITGITHLEFVTVQAVEDAEAAEAEFVKRLAVVAFLEAEGGVR